MGKFLSWRASDGAKAGGPNYPNVFYQARLAGAVVCGGGANKGWVSRPARRPTSEARPLTGLARRNPTILIIPHFGPLVKCLGRPVFGPGFTPCSGWLRHLIFEHNRPYSKTRFARCSLCGARFPAFGPRATTNFKKFALSTLYTSTMAPARARIRARTTPALARRPPPDRAGTLYGDVPHWAGAIGQRNGGNQRWGVQW